MKRSLRSCGIPISDSRSVWRMTKSINKEYFVRNAEICVSGQCAMIKTRSSIFVLLVVLLCFKKRFDIRQFLVAGRRRVAIKTHRVQTGWGLYHCLVEDVSRWMSCTPKKPLE